MLRSALVWTALTHDGVLNTQWCNRKLARVRSRKMRGRRLEFAACRAVETGVAEEEWLVLTTDSKRGQNRLSVGFIVEHGNFYADRNVALQTGRYDRSPISIHFFAAMSFTWPIDQNSTSWCDRLNLLLNQLPYWLSMESSATNIQLYMDWCTSLIINNTILSY